MTTQTKPRVTRDREVRTLRLEPLEVRAGENDEPQKIEGYSAKFNRLSEPISDFWGSTFQEQIAPGAFKKTLAEADIRALWNHDARYVLGRNRSGTLTLREDEHGLWMSTTPPETTWARDLITTMKRGDVNQQSFAFQVIQDKWESERNKETGKRTDIRTLIEVKLFDVSVVTYPAYTDTSAAVRALLEEEGLNYEDLAAVLARKHRGIALDDGDFAVIRAAQAALQTYLPGPETHPVGDEFAPSEPDSHSLDARNRRLASVGRVAANLTLAIQGR